MYKQEYCCHDVGFNVNEWLQPCREADWTVLQTRMNICDGIPFTEDRMRSICHKTVHDSMHATLQCARSKKTGQFFWKAGVSGALSGLALLYPLAGAGKFVAAAAMSWIFSIGDDPDATFRIGLCLFRLMKALVRDSNQIQEVFERSGMHCCIGVTEERLHQNHICAVYDNMLSAMVALDEIMPDRIPGECP
jgi:hypothetical protein